MVMATEPRIRPRQCDAIFTDDLGLKLGVILGIAETDGVSGFAIILVDPQIKRFEIAVMRIDEVSNLVPRFGEPREGCGERPDGLGEFLLILFDARLEIYDICAPID